MCSAGGEGRGGEGRGGEGRGGEGRGGEGREGEGRDFIASNCWNGNPLETENQHNTTQHREETLHVHVLCTLLTLLMVCIICSPEVKQTVLQ